jgi:hypothetical protein
MRHLAFLLSQVNECLVFVGCPESG